jgi:ketosteroid isomerase-like protein
MDIDRLKNPTVRAAIEALQRGDKQAWAALFEPDATLYDDGNPRSSTGKIKRLDIGQAE